MTDPQREHAEQRALYLARTHKGHGLSHPVDLPCTDCKRLADLLLEFAREARLEEAGWWFTQKWSEHVDWKNVVQNPTSYVSTTVKDAQRIAHLQQQSAKGGTT